MQEYSPIYHNWILLIPAYIKPHRRIDEFHKI